jgi:hypothetical protein
MCLYPPSPHPHTHTHTSAVFIMPLSQTIASDVEVIPLPRSRLTYLGVWCTHMIWIVCCAQSQITSVLLCTQQCYSMLSCVVFPWEYSCPCKWHQASRSQDCTGDYHFLVFELLRQREHPFIALNAILCTILKFWTVTQTANYSN